MITLKGFVCLQNSIAIGARQAFATLRVSLSVTLISESSITSVTVDIS